MMMRLCTGSDCYIRNPVAMHPALPHCCWCGGVCVIKNEGKGCSAVQYEPCGIMDLLQGIWIIGEMVRELELELVSDLGPKLLWEAVGKSSALDRKSVV